MRHITLASSWSIISLSKSKSLGTKYNPIFLLSILALPFMETAYNPFLPASCKVQVRAFQVNISCNRGDSLGLHITT